MRSFPLQFRIGLLSRHLIFNFV